MYITERNFGLYAVLAGLFGVGWWELHKQELIPKLDKLKAAVNDEEMQNALNSLKKSLSPEKMKKVLNIMGDMNGHQ